MRFEVEQIDHVEVCVPDRYEAAAWYAETLGLSIVPEYEQWAADPNGPLMIATPGGGTKIALFSGKPTGSREGTGFHLVAFRVSASSFKLFVKSLPELALKDESGQAVSKDCVRDHGQAFSIYFNDPYGNSLEVTTYEYEETRRLLAE